MNDDIEKADRIVGIENRMLCYTRNDPAKNTYRRGAYCEWLAKRPNNASIVDTVEDLSAEVVRIDAEERRKKEPDDGLPPGPWSRSFGLLRDADGKHLFDPYVDDRIDRLADYVVRCGSPAVRRLLVAFHVTEERLNGDSKALVRFPNGVADVSEAIHRVAHKEIICWLTPRSKP